MKKILSILVCVCVLLSAMVFTASAAEASLSFADKSARTSYSTSQQVWEQNGIKLTNDKGASTTNVGDYANPGRFYKSSTVTIECAGMTGIFIDSVTYSDNDYAGAWVNSFDTSLGTAVANDGDVTITFNSAVDSITFEKMAAQARAYSITVYTGNSTPPATEDKEEDKDDATTATLVDAPVADTAYKFGMIQENKSATDVYYLKGGMDGYYMATSSDITAAIDVYLEETTGGYYLYTMVDGVKSYINMVVNGTHVNGAYEAAASTVYTYDATSKTVVATVNDTTYWFGTRNDKTYTTVGPCATSYNGFYCMFYTTASEDVTPPTGGDVTPPAGDEDDKPVELPAPDATNTLTVEEAIELGAAQDTSAYTADKYYVTGKIVDLTNDMYGNMYIADEDGNEILIYGTYGADGKDRYDALASKPDEGDTVTVYGVVGNYNGTPQLKNAWIIEFTAGELDVEAPTEPEADSVLTIEEAIELGLTKRSNEFTTNKYYVTGVITEIYNEEYGNMRITDDAGNILTLYGTWEVLDEIRFDAMENKPAVGDTITVYGVIGQYNGTPQMKNGVFTTAPVTDDDTTNDNDNATGEGTTGDSNANTDNSTTSPSTGDNVGAIVAMAVAAAAVLVASKKR